MSDLVPYPGSQVTGTDVAGLFDPSLDTSITPDERVILSALIRSDERVDLAVPDKIDSDDLWKTLDICCRALYLVRRAGAQLKLLIGRALIVAQDCPAIYERRGYRSFDAFISDEKRGLPAITGISRSELYKSMAVARSVGGSISCDDAREMGFTKMSMLAAITTSENSDFDRWVEAAKTQTIPQFKETIARSNLQIPRDSMEFDLLAINMTKAEKAHISEFLADPLIQAYCQTSSQAIILVRAVEECRLEWMAQAGDA